MIKSIGIIGSGNVAWHLAKGVKKLKHIELSWIFSRNEQHHAELKREFEVDTHHHLPTIPVDLILLCVNDDALQTVLESLPKNQQIAYTSGSVELKEINTDFENLGVFYPLQTFSKNVLLDLSTVPFLIEARNIHFRNLLKEFAEKISKNVHFLDSEQRKQLHISAVFVNNFSNHLYYIAEKHAEKHQLDWDLLKPLMQESVRKVMQNNPFDTQSGPAKRGDIQTIEKHLQELDGTVKSIYQLLSESISKTYKK